MVSQPSNGAAGVLTMQRKRPMKRSDKPLKRVPLARGDYQLKRTGRLRPVSKKRAKQMNQIGPVRAAYRENAACGRCLLNGGELTQADDVHEIVGGPVRPRTMAEPAFWVPLCRACHDHIQSVPDARPEVFAAKVVAELLRVNDMLAELGRGPIDMRDVVEFLK